MRTLPSAILEFMLTRDEMVTELAKVLNGLMVPLSLSGEMGMNILGAATDPYRGILTDMGRLGYPDVSEWETYLRERLGMEADEETEYSDGD